jgi:putative addiction module killer protein
MITIIQTKYFRHWLSKVKDYRVKALIINRIRSAELGNFGDSKSIGEGVSEMQIHFGPGYRVYFTRVGETVYFLFCGGSKKDQQRDIRKVKILAQELKES